MAWVFNPFTGTFDQTGTGGGGGGSPGGSALQLQYNNSGAFGGMAGTSWDNTNRSLTLTGATVTTSKPVLDLSQTWNAGAVTFTGLKFNATDTASAAGSLLADLQVGGASKFAVDKSGDVILPNGSFIGNSGGFSSVYFWNTNILLLSAAGNNNVALNGTNTTLLLRDTFSLGWGTNIIGAPDLRLTRDAANTLALRNGAGQAQSFRVYNTYPSAADNEYGTFDWSTSANVLTIGTVKNGTGFARALNLATDGTGRWQISTAGHLLAVTNNTYDIGANAGNRPRTIYAVGAFVGSQIQCDGNYNGFGGVKFTGSSAINATSDGLITLSNAALNDFGRLHFGGNTSSYPALKRSSATLAVRLADDSGYTTIDAQLRSQGSAPASATATGTAGDIRYDSGYIYVCTAANTWVRAALATW